MRPVIPRPVIPRPVLLLLPAGIALGVTAEWVRYGPDYPRFGGPDPTATWIADLATGWILQAAGFIAWVRVPASRVGPLLVLCGMAWFIGNFDQSHDTAVVWFATTFALLHLGFVMHALTTYPTGRSSSQLEWAAVILGYGTAMVVPLWSDPIAIALLSLVLAGVAVIGYRRARASLRRARLLAAQVAMVTYAWLVAIAGARILLPRETSGGAALLAYEAVVAGAAVLLSAGIARKRRRDAHVTDVVVELIQGTSPTLRDVLADALGDPTLDVGYWLPESDRYVRASGMPLDPHETNGRVATRIERDGQPVAILFHDPSLLEDAAMVELIAAATRLAADNDRLRAESLARLRDLEASRRRLVVAGDEERLRLEVRLRTGARHQLESLASSLLDVESAARTSHATVESIQRAQEQARLTLDDLQVLARGLHPRVLTEVGLAGALDDLRKRSQVVINMNVTADALVDQEQRTAWFICLEALTNVTKHAGASTASVSVRCDEQWLVVEVVDDGVGGAEAVRGSGLRGLADRAEALGGSLSVDSPVGAGTRVVARIPRLATSERKSAEPVAGHMAALVETPAGTDEPGNGPLYGRSHQPFQGGAT